MFNYRYCGSARHCSAQPNPQGGARSRAGLWRSMRPCAAVNRLQTGSNAWRCAALQCRMLKPLCPSSHMLCVRECICVRVCVSGTLIRAGHHFHFRIRGLRLKRALVSLQQLHCSAEQPAPWWLMLLTCAYRKPGNVPPWWASHRMCVLSWNVTDRQTGRPITF